MKVSVNLETLGLAAGCIRALRGRDPDVFNGYDYFSVRYRALVVRAHAVTEETTYKEFLDIWNSFTDLAAQHGALPTNGMEN